MDYEFELEKKVQNVCFNNTVLKAIYDIFYRLIILSNKISEKMTIDKILLILIENTKKFISNSPQIKTFEEIYQLNNQIITSHNSSKITLKVIEKHLYSKEKNFYAKIIESLNIIGYNKNYHIDLNEYQIYEEECSGIIDYSKIF